MQRRELLAAGAGIALSMAMRASASPVLSARNFGLSLAKAKRRNGWIEVDAGAFEANIDSVRALIGSVRLCAVMKADAYGNSIALLIPSILRKRIDTVAITSNDEARVARELGYRGRLVRIRTAALHEVEDGMPLAIEEMIGNADVAESLQRLASGKRWRRTNIPVHLAVNCGGMSRNGVELSAAQGQASIRRILACDRLDIRGVMTHYPTENQSDIADQLQRYRTDLAQLEAQGLQCSRLIRHTANSFATLAHPETWLDMVRVGGLLYGDPGSVTSDRFLPTMTIKSVVAAVSRYPAGQTVSYDRTYRLDRDSWLANIPIGYSDGYRRGFSHANQPQFSSESRNRTEVLIGGVRLPVVGRVSMNNLMVDVTDHIDRVHAEDEVVLFGAQGKERIGQAEFEANSAAFGPELLSVLGATLPRVLASST